MEKQLKPDKYHVALIAALEIEVDALCSMLDEKHKGTFPSDAGHDFVYQAGKMAGHNVIIATLPPDEEYGPARASALSAQFKTVFKNLRFGLLVGVAAGVPRLGGQKPRDVRLGDVLVALAERHQPSLINLDLGKETSEGFELVRNGVMNRTETIVRSAIGAIKQEDRTREQPVFLRHYEKMMGNKQFGELFADPGQDADHLYGVDNSEIKRPSRVPQRRTQVWYGAIGSCSKLVKNASKRDELSDKYNLIGFEMEAAGVLGNMPVGVIRSASDYGDEHKNDKWQPYAAAMATAYAKEILSRIGVPNSAKRVHHLPFPRNVSFTGRDEIIEGIVKRLFSSGQRVVALSGLGGMGKTQVALEIAHRVIESREEYAVLWLSAQSKDAMLQSARQIVNTLCVKCDPEESPLDVLQHYLSFDAEGPWFLVADNVDDVSVVKGTILDRDLERHWTEGRILVTSRTSIVASIVADPQNAMELKEMAPEEASSFLKKVVSEKNFLQEKEAELTIPSLMEKLSFFPLAIGQAVTYMNANRLPIGEYLRLLDEAKDEHGEMINWLDIKLRDEVHYDKSQGALATTWIVSFKKICKENADAARLLSFIRHIGAKSIPSSILPGPHWKLMDGETGERWDKEDSKANILAIMELCRYSFLTWQGGDASLVDMHRLVHLAIQVCPEDMFEGLMTQRDAVYHISNVFPTNNLRYRTQCQQYLPHARVSLTPELVSHDLSAAVLGMKIGPCLRAQLLFKEAVDLAETAAEFCKNNSSNRELFELFAFTQMELGFSYIEDGQNDKAIEIFKKLQQDNDIVVQNNAQDALAAAYSKNGNKDRALELWIDLAEKAEQRTRVPGLNTRLGYQMNVANCHISMGNCDKAIKILQYIADIEPKEAINSKEVYAAKCVLANAYTENLQPEKAIKLIQPLTTSHRNELADTDPLRLDLLETLTDAYLANDDTQLALATTRLFVEILPLAVDDYNLPYLKLKVNLAQAYIDDDQCQKGREWTEHVLDQHKKFKKRMGVDYVRPRPRKWDHFDGNSGRLNNVSLGMAVLNQIDVFFSFLSPQRASYSSISQDG